MEEVIYTCDCGWSGCFEDLFALSSDSCCCPSCGDVYLYEDLDAGKENNMKPDWRLKK